MSQTRLLSLLATLIAVPVSAQGGTACLQGRVYGAAGSPLLGARVLLLNTGAAVATDIEGRFAFPELRPDTVSVRVTYIGYKSGMVTGLQLSVGRTVLQDFTLEESKVTISETGGAPPPGMVGNAARPQPANLPVAATKCPIAVPEHGDGSYVDKLAVGDISRTVVLNEGVRPTPGQWLHPGSENTYVDGVPTQRRSMVRDTTVGLVQGTIRDGQRRPVAGARIAIEGTPYYALSDSVGHYALRNVSVGLVTLVLSKDGYGISRFEGLPVYSDRTTTRDLEFIPTGTQRP